jgi:exopolysaccharide production protein ExoQ
MDPLLIGILAVPFVAIPLIALILTRPRDALAVAPMLLMLALIKFRNRDPLASPMGVFDDQVAFELGLYALVLLIALRGLLLLPLSRFRVPPVGVLLGGYVTVAALSSLWSATPEFTAVRGIQLLILATYTLVAVTILGPQHMLRTFGASLVWFVLFFSALAKVFPWADGTRIPAAGPHLARFSWFYLHPITVGTFMGSAAVFVVAWILYAPERRPQWAIGLPTWLFLPPLVMVLFQTRARGPIIAFLFAALLLLTRKYLVGRRAYLTSDRLLLGLLGFGLATATYVVTGRGYYRVRNFFLRGQQVEYVASFSGRDELWETALAVFMERPLFGHGYVAAREALLSQSTWLTGHAHNGFLESLLSTGLTGAALLWMSVLILLCSSFLRMMRTEPCAAFGVAYIASAISFLVLCSLLETSFAGPAGHEVLLLFLLVFSYSRLAGEPDTKGMATPVDRSVPASVSHSGKRLGCP